MQSYYKSWCLVFMVTNTNHAKNICSWRCLNSPCKWSSTRQTSSEACCEPTLLSVEWWQLIPSKNDASTFCLGKIVMEEITCRSSTGVFRKNMIAVNSKFCQSWICCQATSVCYERVRNTGTIKRNWLISTTLSAANTDVFWYRLCGMGAQKNPLK